MAASLSASLGIGILCLVVIAPILILLLSVASLQRDRFLLALASAMVAIVGCLLFLGFACYLGLYVAGAMAEGALVGYKVSSTLAISSILTIAATFLIISVASIIIEIRATSQN